MKNISASTMAFLISAVLAGTGLSLVADPAPANAAQNCLAAATHSRSGGGKAQIPSGSARYITECVMGTGRSNDAVTALQKSLNACYKAGLKEDGDFGSKTRTALINAQKTAGTKADGIFGPNTRDAIKWVYRLSDGLGVCKKYSPWG